MAEHPEKKPDGRNTSNGLTSSSSASSSSSGAQPNGVKGRINRLIPSSSSTNPQSTPEKPPPLTQDLIPIPNPPYHSPHPTLPALNYKPSVLRPKALFASLIYHASLFAILTAATRMKELVILRNWTSVCTKILPIALGTVSSEILLAYLLSISSISPYMKCVTSSPPFPEGSNSTASCGSGSSSNKNTAKASLLFPYFPFPHLRHLFRARDYLLISTKVLFIFGMNLSPIKASLFDTESASDDSDPTGIAPSPNTGTDTHPTTKAQVQIWAAYALMAIYGLVVLHTILLLFFFRKKTTGLRWSPGSLASMLALFRHSDFLPHFEGTCIATRRSMVNRLGNFRLRLGYWRLQDGNAWHGFGLDPAAKAANEKVSKKLLLLAKEEREVTLSGKQISTLRYNQTFWVLRRPTIILFSGVSLLVSFGYLFTIYERWNSPILHPRFMGFLVTFLSEFIPTLIATCMTFYLENVAQVTSLLEPFVQMSKANLGDSQPGGTPESTILLNYRRFRPVATCLALQNRHWRVFLINIIAMAQRGLPIVVGAAVTVQDGSSDVKLSKPMFVLIGGWFLLYAITLPMMFLGGKQLRKMPRSPRSIGDVLSLACSSSLLSAKEVSSTYSQTEEAHKNPLDVQTGTCFTEKHLEANVLLYGKDCAMGLCPPHDRHGPTAETVGIDWADRVTRIPAEVPKKGSHPNNKMARGKEKGESRSATVISSQDKLVKEGGNSKAGYNNDDMSPPVVAAEEIEEAAPSLHNIPGAGKFRTIATVGVKGIWSDVGHLCGQACSVSSVEEGTDKM